MIKKKLYYLFLILCLFFGSFVSFSQSNQSYFIKFKQGFDDVNSLKNFPGIESFKQPFVLKEMQNVYLIQLTSKDVEHNLRNYLIQKNALDYIELVPKHELFYIPNDLSVVQYNLNITNAVLAWDLDNNASDKTIAIIDDAIDINHVDLNTNIYINLSEISGNGIDDDLNGFIDDVNGWDFADADNNANPPNTTLSHGTHVAGIASARMDNSIGIAAIGANAKILPIKIGQDIGGALINTFAAIEYAILMQVDVINMSWGGSAYSSTFQTLFDIAYNNNIVCVAAAGNSSTNAPMYPASYNHVISVASSDITDMKSIFSNYGPTIDLAAPGSGIYSTLPFSNYGNKSGTSMAAPYIAGLAALMLSAAPLSTVDDIEQCLENTCDPVVGPLSTQVGGGRVNAYAAMQCIAFPEAIFSSQQTTTCPGNTISYIDQSIGINLTYSWSFPGGIPNTSTLQNPIITYPTAGFYPVTLQVSNGVNLHSVTTANYATIGAPTAIISGFSSINSGSFGSIVINFNGNPPYDVIISDGTTVSPVTGITTSPYLHFFNPTTTSNYTLTNFSDALCAGTPSGMATINVNSISGGVCIDSLSTFIKYLGTNVDDVAMAVKNIDEHGFIVMGRKNISASSFRNYICRIDNCGNVIWEKLYNPNSYGIPVSALMDGNEILIAGYHNTSGLQTYLLRLDLNGNIINSKTFGGAATYPRKMIKTANGELVFGGVTNSSSAGSNDFHLTRTDVNGNVIWQKAYGGSANDFGANVIEDGNTDLISLGYSRNYIPGLYKGRITKVDANGIHLWTKEYHMGNGFTILGDIAYYQNFHYVSGQTNFGTQGAEDQLVMKLDLSGNVIWSKLYGGPGYDVTTGIRVRNDTIYVQGISSSGATSREATICRLSLTGNLIDYVGLGTNNDEGAFTAGQTLELGDNYGIYGIAHGDGGLIGQDDIIFYKINSFLDICTPLTVVINEVNVVLVEEVFSSVTTNSNWSFVNTGYTGTVVASNQGYICDSLQYFDTTNVFCGVLADFDTLIPTCLLDSVSFIDMSLDSNGFNLFIYNFGDLSAPLQTTDSINYHYYNNIGTYPVQLIAIDTISGCSDTLIKMITITSSPSIQLADTVIACLNDSLDINAVPNCISVNAIIDWSPNTDIVFENNYNATILPISSGYIYITINDNGLIISDSVFIQIDPNCCVSLPQIEIDPNSNFCGSGLVDISNTSISNSGVPVYTWQFLPDGIPINFNGTTPPQISFIGSGLKNIVFEMTDGCGVYIDTFAIYIHENPLFNPGLDEAICVSSMVTLGEEQIAGWQYDWSPGHLVSDSTISNPTALINANTDFQVTVTNVWTGCLLIDTVSFIYDSVYINIILNDTVICVDGQTEIMIPFESSINSNIFWSSANLIKENNINNILVELDDNNTFIATSTSSTGICTDTDSVKINVIESLIPVLINTEICEDDTYLYYTTGDWQGDLNGNLIAINETGEYFFQESNTCSSVQHEIKITTIDCNCFIYVPNVFTPDYNSYNNTFKAEVKCDLLDFYRLDVYNRWGELLYRSYDPSSEWDGNYGGKPVQDGVYIWQIEYTETTSSEVKELRGHITILN